MRTILLLSLCISMYHVTNAQKFEVGANWGFTSPVIDDYGFPNKLYEIKGSYNFNKRFQAGLITGYYPGTPYKFIPPSEFNYKGHGFRMGWDPDRVINYPNYMLIATTDIINPKIYGSIKSNFRKFYFSFAISAGYIHAVGLPSGGLLPLVDATISSSGYTGKDEFLTAYRKAMRPTGGYSLGVQPGITFYVCKNLGVNAALNIEHLAIRDPKFVLYRSWSHTNTRMVSFGISYRFGTKKKEPVRRSTKH